MRFNGHVLVFVLGLGSASFAFGDSSDVIIKGKGKTFHTGLKPTPKEYRGLGKTFVRLDDCNNLPEEFDLRDLDVVGPIKDQANCGSCWAFSETASLESATAASSGNGTVLDLSEQQLVSCDKQNYGCNGGLLNNFGYQTKTGQALESSFPYKASDLKCKTGLKTVAKASSFVQVGDSFKKPAEKDVMCALFKSHTIPWVTVSATDSWSNMSTDSDAIYTQCAAGQPNHAIGIVGWKTVNKKVYFKIRNSWSTSWGSNAGRPDSEAGYAMMKLGCDSLGDEVAYIVTPEVGCDVPEVKLPVEVVASASEALPLAVKEQSGVSYEWFENDVSIGTGASVAVHAQEGKIYKVVAKNSCATSESATRARVLN